MGFGVLTLNPAISFIATAMVPLWNDCTSNIVDVGRETLCIDPEEVNRYKIKGEVLIAVDEAALCDYNKLRKNFGGFIIQDCAHTVGILEQELTAMHLFGHFRQLIMPAGDGGMITTNDKKLADKVEK